MTDFAYKFCNSASGPKPNNEMTRLLEKASCKENMCQLTREEKDRVAEILHGAGSSCYKLAGWAWPMSRVLPRILVKQYGSWQEYYAPDKTSLRKVLYGKIQEMVVG